jgi:hypothetical protein
MSRKAATTLALLLVFGTASAVLADANNRTDYQGSFGQRPVSMMSNGRTGAVNGAAKPFTTEKNASFAASPLVLAQSAPVRRGNAAIAVPPASSQAADAQAQTDSFSFAPQRLTPDVTSGKTLRPSARRGRKGWIALHRPDGEVVYIKVDQIVFVMSAKDTGAAERARSKVQLLAGHSDVRESVEEVMQTIENDGSIAKDGSDMSSASGVPRHLANHRRA